MTDVASEKSIFLNAAGLAPAEREAYLAAACGPDAALRTRVEALLAAHDHLGTGPVPADDTAAAPGPPTVRLVPGPGPGAVIAGRYTLVEKLGEGGMGQVWAARQTDPVERTVALKLIRPGMDSKGVLARFQLERQALALMDHPNIAKVLDGGLTDDGRPFFVMELVRGLPFTRYCDDAKLTPRQRLELFVPVCQAVQHAHQKGVIHRDLKPSNVLVPLYDGKPVPKVIDFGVAKAAGGWRTDESLFTQFGSVVGTLEYMAPEQAAPGAMDVDTRADVYALGVVLYELLTGLRPFDGPRLRAAALDEMFRILREEDPPKPSTRLSSDASLASAAAVRQTDPKRLTGLMKRELDWVVMKCLEKDRNRRYETASGLARDIERFLREEPVEARPPSAAYRMQKFVRKHRGPVVAAGMVLVALVAGIAGTTVGMVRAEDRRAEAEDARANEAARAEGERQARLAADAAQTKEAAERARAEASEKRAVANEKRAVAQRKIAEAVRQFLLQDLLRQADVTAQANAALLPGAGFETKQNPTIRELLNRAATQLTTERLAARFPGQVELHAELLQTVGITYRGVGDYAKAADFLRRAANLSAAHRGPDDRSTLTALASLASVHQLTGRLTEAVRLSEEVRDRRVKALGPDDPDTLIALNDLAVAYHTAGRSADAIPLLERLRDVRAKRFEPAHPETLTVVENLAAIYVAVGRPAEAIPLLEQLHDVRNRRPGPDHPSSIRTMTNLAAAYLTVGRVSDATTLFEQVRDTSVRRFPPDHPTVLLAQTNVAAAYREAGRPTEAIRLFEHVREVGERKFGPNDPSTLKAAVNLAYTYRAAGRLPDALRLYEQTMPSYRRVFGPTHRDVVNQTRNWAIALEEAGQRDRALDLYRDLVVAARQHLPPNDPRLASALGALGWKLLQAGRPADAEPILRECLAFDERDPDAWGAHVTRAQLGRALAGQGKYAEAEPLLLAGYEGLTRWAPKAAPLSRNRLPETAGWLAALYAGWGNSAEAAKWRAERDAYPPPTEKGPRPRETKSPK
jgi:tetratricopeptide (TPR) repeat protein